MPFTLGSGGSSFGLTSQLGSNQTPSGGFGFTATQPTGLFDQGQTVGQQSGKKAGGGGEGSVGGAAIGAVAKMLGDFMKADATAQAGAQKASAEAQKSTASSQQKQRLMDLYKGPSGFRLGG